MTRCNQRLPIYAYLHLCTVFISMPRHDVIVSKPSASAYQSNASVCILLPHQVQAVSPGQKCIHVALLACSAKETA